jgi:MFS family permease
LNPGSGRWLAALCTSRVLAATWFVAYSAVLPLTQAEWGLSAREAGMVQAGFHLGYLTSLFIVGFIADHFGAKRAYITTGVAACLSPWAFVLFADGFWSAFWLHAFTGLCQGGTYTPALALINDHVERARRGRAMGYLIAGSSAGYAICLLAAGAALHFTGWRGALAVVALLPVVSWITGVWVLRKTPNTVHARPAGESLLASLPAVWRNRKGMLSIWSYTFHNWELLGLWAWLPAFLTAALLLQGYPPENALMFAALTYVANIAGSIVGGTMADRWGRLPTILTWSCVSLALSFSIGWLMALPLVLLIALACVYNFAGIADSSTHSLVLAESVPPHYLGVAYAVRSVIGFGAGVVSPVVFGWALDATGGTWGFAWVTLGLGALLGPVCTWRLRRMG